MRAFRSQFGESATVSAMEAVETLRLVYGEDRRVLLLVDKLSKANRQGHRGNERTE